MTKKILIAGLSVFALAGSFVVTSPVVNAQTKGTISADSADVVFCEPRSGTPTTYRYRGSRASFDSNNIVYIMPKNTPRLANGDCNPDEVTQVVNIPAFSGHTTSFRVDLNTSSTPIEATIENIVVTNNNPRFQSNTVCVAPGQTARFVTTDADDDSVEILDVYDEINDSMVNISYDTTAGKSQKIEVDSEDGFVGEVRFTAEIRDEVMKTGGVIPISHSINEDEVGTDADIRSVSGDATFDLPEKRLVKADLIAVFANNCSMMSSSSSSMMMSSSSSSSSSMMSSSSSSSVRSLQVNQYAPLVGKGGTPRTGTSK